MKPVILACFTALAFSAAAAAGDGEQVFERWCVHCHGPQPAAPGRLQIERIRGEQYSLLTERSDLTPEYVIAIVRRGLAEMPSFRKTEISDSDLAVLVEFLTTPATNGAAADAP